MQSGSQSVSGVSGSTHSEQHDSKITSILQDLDELKALFKAQKDGKLVVFYTALKWSLMFCLMIL